MGGGLPAAWPRAPQHPGGRGAPRRCRYSQYLMTAMLTGAVQVTMASGRSSAIAPPPPERCRRPQALAPHHSRGRRPWCVSPSPLAGAAAFGARRPIAAIGPRRGPASCRRREGRAGAPASSREGAAHAPHAEPVLPVLPVRLQRSQCLRGPQYAQYATTSVLPVPSASLACSKKRPPAVTRIDPSNPRAPSAPSQCSQCPQSARGREPPAPGGPAPPPAVCPPRSPGYFYPPVAPSQWKTSHKRGCRGVAWGGDRDTLVTPWCWWAQPHSHGVTLGKGGGRDMGPIPPQINTQGMRGRAHTPPPPPSL